MPGLRNAAPSALALPFRVASRLRGKKSFHPSGVGFESVLTVTSSPEAPAATLVGEAGKHRALVRFSRALGLPARTADILGISIRVPDAYGPGRHQDLLLVSSGDGPVVHHALLPTTDPQKRPYSSLLPYAADGRRFLVGALPRDDSPRPPADSIDGRLRAAAATGRLSFDFALAPLLGRFVPVGRLDVSATPADLERTPFNPVLHTGGGMRPTADPLSRWRAHAYPGSQAGWAGAAESSRP